MIELTITRLKNLSIPVRITSYFTKISTQ